MRGWEVEEAKESRKRECRKLRKRGSSRGERKRLKLEEGGARESRD